MASAATGCAWPAASPHPARSRSRIISHWREVARAHGEVFAAIRPAATAVIVAGLLDPAWLAGIEAEAVLPV